jgi:uncharacterized protein (TIRG00374 family)
VISTLDTTGPWGLCRRLASGALAFASLTVAGLAGVFAVNTSRAGGMPRAWELHAGFLVAAVAGALLDVVLAAARYQIFLRLVPPGGSLRLPIRADLAGRFLGAVTPSQSGGGPAQVFVLQRAGVPIPAALSLLAVNLLATLAFFLVAGGLAAWWLRDRLGPGVLRVLVRYGFTAVLTVFVAMVLALVRPDLVARPVGWIAHHLGGPGGGRGPAVLEAAARRLASSLDQYRTACRRFTRERPLLPAASFLLTAAMYLNKFTVAWFVLRGLGSDCELGATVGLVALLHLGVFMAPTPGGSGIAEMATGTAVSALAPDHLIGPFTCTYRLLVVYLPAAAGAVVLLGEIGRRARRPRALAPGAWGRPRRSRSPRVTVARLGLVLAGGLAVPTGLADARVPAPPDVCTANRCPLCMGTAPSATPLPGERLESMAERLAAANRRELDRIDALLRSGALGPPQSHAACRRAQLLARLTLANWYAFMAPLALDPVHVWSVEPQALEAVAARFCEATVVPPPRLHELRLGRGRVCARYDLSGPDEEGVSVLGGRQLRHRLRELRLDGASRRVLILEWQSAGAGKVELLLGEHYGFRLGRHEVGDGEALLDLFVALEVEGGWVRRFGVHRPAAFAFWATRPPREPPYLPPAPRVGSAIYLPGLVFRLPLLPDFELQDLRILALPMPLLEVQDMRRGALPSWLGRTGDLTLDSWTSLGNAPAALHERCPDR